MEESLTNRISPVPVEVPDTYLDAVAKFIGLQEDISRKMWEQAAIVGGIEGSLEGFAKDTGISTSWAYKLRKLYRTFGTEPVAEHLSPTAHIHIAEKVKGDSDRGRQWAAEAADAELSKRKTASAMKSHRTPEEYHDARENREEPEPAKRERRHTCPTCAGGGTVDWATLRRMQAVG